jgi:hypothetical protein
MVREHLFQTSVEHFRNRVGSATYARLLTRLREVNHDICTRGIRPYAGSTLVTGYSYEEFYDWDLYFENLYLSHYGVSQYCRNNLEIFLERQLASGFVARTLINPRQRQHFKPFLAQTALLGCRQMGDTRWLRGKYYDRLKKYLDYWFWFQDFDKNGLAVWHSADHSGMDNQESRAGEMDALTVEGVDLNSYLVRELQAMALLAEALDKGDDRDRYIAQAQALTALLQRTFWHDADGFYYDRDERKAALVKVKSVAGFVPLWLDAVVPEAARRLVNEHLCNPDEFWLQYPISTYARTEPDYYQARTGDECNWRGTTWIPTNYMVFHGLLKHGYTEIAEDLAYKTFEMVLRETSTREYYNAETGVGQGLNPFWGWSALAYVMPLEFEMRHDPTALTLEPLAAPVRDMLTIKFE